MFDYSKLHGKIKEICKTQYEFAECMGVSNPTLSARLHGRSFFSQKEIDKACEVLGILKEEIPVYFFTSEVKEKEQSA